MAKIAKKTVLFTDGTATGVRFDFENGHSHWVKLDDLSESLQAYAACHGLLQKFGDAYSQNEGIADAEEKFLAVVAQVRDDRTWNKTTRGTGDDSLLAAALERVTGKTPDEVAERLASMDEGEIKGLKANAQIKAAMAAIKAERLAEAAADGPALNF